MPSGGGSGHEGLLLQPRARLRIEMMEGFSDITFGSCDLCSLLITQTAAVTCGNKMFEENGRFL